MGGWLHMEVVCHTSSVAIYPFLNTLNFRIEFIKSPKPLTQYA